MQTLWRDLRHGVRILKKNPGFMAVAVVTLAMAIGANALVFGVLNTLLLRPLNLPEEESLSSARAIKRAICPILTILIFATATAPLRAWPLITSPR